MVIEGRTIPYKVVGIFGASRVVMTPCEPGRGIIASGPVRAVMEAAGIHDISAKTLGSNNPHNVLKATLFALYDMKSHEEAAARRGVPVERLRAAMTG